MLGLRVRKREDTPRTCPWCRETLDRAQLVSRCPACHTLSHLSCQSEWDACATLGCARVDLKDLARCVRCRDAVRSDQDEAACSVCRLPYHAGCLATLGRCRACHTPQLARRPFRAVTIGDVREPSADDRVLLAFQLGFLLLVTLLFCFL